LITKDEQCFCGFREKCSNGFEPRHSRHYFQWFSGDFGGSNAVLTDSDYWFGLQKQAFRRRLFIRPNGPPHKSDAAHPKGFRNLPCRKTLTRFSSWCVTTKAAKKYAMLRNIIH
jgi:hypothetical protein